MIVLVCGIPGSGKSLTTAYMTQRVNKTGRLSMAGNLLFEGDKKVYSNFPIQGAYKLQNEDIGQRDLHDCLVILDEALSFADSRKWKDFPKTYQDFFRIQCRKMGVTAVICSQSFTDVDVRIRSVCDIVFICKQVTLPVIHKQITCWDVCKPYIKPTEKTIEQGYELQEGLLSRLTSWFWSSKYYDDFDTKALTGSGQLQKSLDELWKI